MRDSTGARIIFPTAEDQDQELITVVGTEEAVKEATKELEELIRSLVSAPRLLEVLCGLVAFNRCPTDSDYLISNTLF